MASALFEYAVTTSGMQIATLGFGVAVVPSITVILAWIFGQDVIPFDCPSPLFFDIYIFK